MKRKLVYISVSYAVGLIFASMSLEKYGITVILAGFLIFFSICRARNTDEDYKHGQNNAFFLAR